MPVDAGALASSLQKLLGTLDVSPTAPRQELGQRIGEVLSAASDVLDVGSVGLMLLDDADALRVVGVSDQVVAALETAQQRLGVGPAIDSLRIGRTVGSLNAVRTDPQQWSPDQARAVQAYADIIGVLLRLGRAGRVSAEPSDSGGNDELE